MDPVILIIVSVVTLILVVWIALGVIDYTVTKTSRMPRQTIVDINESIEFCAEALPQETTSQISYDDLTKALRLHLEWIQAYHWSPSNSSEKPILFKAEDPVKYMIERADILELEITNEQLKDIANAHYEYLISKGALHIQPAGYSAIDLANKPEIEQTEN